MLEQSTLPGFLTMIGSGKVIASSNGPVHFLELPCRVDEQAVLGWADCPSPSYRYDYEHVKGWVSAVGAVTGTVLIQSSERGVDGGSALAHLLAQLSALSRAELTQVSATAQQHINDSS
jgi:hypothetical protein